MTDESNWLTVSDAAKLSGYNPEYITRLIRQGVIKGRKVSIVWLVDSESLLAYAEKARNLGEKRGPKSEN